MISKDATTNGSRTITPIDGTNGRFEYYQYNEDLRIIHSVEDDMFHAGSIIKALGSTKEANKWFDNKETRRLLTGFAYLEENCDVRLRVYKTKFNNKRFIEGTYIHRLLVNHFAMWVSPEYAYKISIILDDHFELQRKVEENRALSDENKTLLQKVDELIIQNRETHRKLDESNRKLDETKNELSNANHKLDTIKADMKAIAPVASGLTNRISSPLSEEYLLINYTENDNGTVEIYYNAVNPTTIKKRKIRVEDSWIYQRFANSVDAQNRLLSLVEERSLNIARINRRQKSFIMHSFELETLEKIVKQILPELLNKESKYIKNRANNNKETAKTEQSNVSVKEDTHKAPEHEPKRELYMGYLKDYCDRIVKLYDITIDILTDIINKEYTYGAKKYPIRLHPTDGIVYGKSINGKRRWYILPDDSFADSD